MDVGTHLRRCSDLEGLSQHALADASRTSSDPSVAFALSLFARTRRRVTKNAIVSVNADPLQPDLVFDNGRAVADVKYKLHHGPWQRNDLYEEASIDDSLSLRVGFIRSL